MTKETSPLLTLTQWAEQRYGANAPHLNTLRRWAANGNIQPRPQKHGKPFMVDPSAVYVPSAQGAAS